jgi:hypothetical protein
MKEKLMHKSDMIIATLSVILKEQYYVIQITEDGIDGVCSTHRRVRILSEVSIGKPDGRCRL